MSTILISTRKGLFEAQASGGAYSVTRGHFIGDNVSVAMADPRGGWYAALDHGHFGVKLHRSDDRGATWTEIAVPGNVFASSDRGESWNGVSNYLPPVHAVTFAS